MIRKCIILMFTLAAAGTSYLWAGSYLHFLHLPVANEPGPFGLGCVVPDSSIPNPMLVKPTFRRSGIALEKGSVLLLLPNHPSHYGCKRGRPLVKVGGFYFEASQCLIHRRPWQRYAARLPLWLPTILLAAYPIIAFYCGPRRRLRRRRGECIGCGYDLTGNESGVCPECGKAT